MFDAEHQMSHWRWNEIIFTIFATVSLVFAPALIGARQHPTPPPPQPRQSPNAPTNQNVPEGLEKLPSSPDTDRASVDAQNQREIRLSVERLYTMVSELKDEVEHTNSNMVLNVSVVKRARNIEKLAKQIKVRAGR